MVRRGGAPVDFAHGRGPGSAATEDGDPAQPRAARPRHVGQAPVPRQGHRRPVLRAARLHGLPDLLLGARARRRSSAGPPRARSRRRRCRSSSATSSSRGTARRSSTSCSRSRISGVSRTLSPPARPPSRGRGLRPAEPALRQVQGRGDDAAGDHRRGRSRPARAVRGAGRRGARRCTASSSRPASRRGRPVRVPQRHPHEPRHDDEPAGAHPHVGPAPVHDGPVGDPPAVPADPPRDLRRVAVPGLVPGAQVRRRWATATSSTTATSTAPSGRTRTTSWPPGRRSATKPRRPAGSCRSPESDRRRGAPSPIERGSPSA